MKLLIVLVVCLLASVASAASSRQLLTTCGEPDPATTYPPLNALLYLSGDTNGTAKYECDTNGRPKQTPISVDGDFVNPQGWEGVVFRNKDGFLQLDLGQFQNDTMTFANSTVVLDNVGVVYEPVPNSLPFGRWSVLSNDGEGPPRGLVAMSYVTRIDTSGGAPGTKSCLPGEIVSSNYQATYNLYTCDPNYLPAPAPAPALAPVPSTLIAPMPAILPIVVPPVLAPRPAPMPAPMPATIAPAPVPAVRPILPVAVIPVPAPPSSAGVSSSRLAAGVAMILSAALVLV